MSNISVEPCYFRKREWSFMPKPHHIMLLELHRRNQRVIWMMDTGGLIPNGTLDLNSLLGDDVYDY